VKVNQTTHKASMFEAEALGLQEMATKIRVPHPLCWGVASAQSYLVLEWIDFGRSRSVSFGESPHWAEMGRQLADLHRITHPQRFGWHRDNTIGETPQPNPWTQDWADFFADYRIGYQLKLAEQKGMHFSQSEALLQAIPKMLAEHDPQPSLVHGDLWSGNAAFDTAGAPVIFDPATYYGDREVDLAMTELFGGFPESFYEGYQAAWPLKSGYRQRKMLYNLYHILNHFNLFGGSYAGQAEQMVRQVIDMV
jgi:fructosamine-3-kinase